MKVRDTNIVRSAWHGLGRRKVVQWGIGYAAAAWTVLQVVEYLSETYAWPPVIRQVATLALVLGLPLVLVIAWYHGDRGSQEVTGAEIALLATYVAIGGTVLWWYGSNVQPRPDIVRTPARAAGETAAPELPSIAVLPFVNMSSDPEQDYFADGLSEELLNLLARMPELRVIGRTSSFQFKGRNEDLRLIGEKLGADHLLEGSVRRSDRQVRITAQLIRAQDGSHVWSETYDRRLEDIFAVQDDIARQVASALKVVLVAAPSSARPRSVTGNLTAYDMYLEGRYLFNTRTLENVSRGIELLRAATERDPGFAEAQATYAVAVMVSRDYQPQDFGGVVPAIQAERAARHALELNETLAEAHAALGMIEASRLKWRQADAHFRRAIADEPYNGMANLWYGNLLRELGRIGDAVPYYETARRFDPQSPIAVGNLAMAYAATGREDDARDLLATAEDRGMKHPTFGIAKITMGVRLGDQAMVEAGLVEWSAFFPGWLPQGAEHVLAQAAFDPEARPAAKQLLVESMRDEKQLATWGTLLVAALARDFDTAFAAADAGLPSSGGSWGVALWHPAAAEWRTDPRFRQLVERLQMPPYWREAGWPDSCKPNGPSDFVCGG